MRILFAFMIFLFGAGMNNLQAEGIEFFHGTWEEALEKAAEEEKLIFVDAFTVWCGPCKRMAKNIFPLKEVGEFYNANFVNVKLDMEKGEGRNFRSKYRVNSFPTFLFIDGTGKAVLTQVGGMQADRFIGMGQKAIDKIDYSVEYAAKYEEGDRTAELLYNYAMSLVKSKKASLKVANEYLRTQTDLTSEKNLRFIHANTTEADSRIFDLLIKNKPAITGLVGQEKVQAQIFKACNNTVVKAIEFESSFLLEEAKEKMKVYFPAKADEFASSADLDFNLNMGNTDAFIKAADKYFKKTSKDKSAEMNRVSVETFNLLVEDEKAMAAAEKWMKKASSAGDNPDYLFNYALILYQNGKDDGALEAANKALKFATELKKDTRNINRLIHDIENKA